MTDNEEGKGAGYVLIAAVMWGTIGPAQSLAAGILSPGAVAGWRHLIGGAALLAFCLPHLPELRHRDRRFWFTVVVTGAIGAGYQVAFLTSVALTGAALGTVLGVATVPLFSGLAARWTGGPAITRRWVWGSAAAIVGCGILFVPSGESRVDLIGAGSGILAGALFAAYTVAAKRMTSRAGDIKATTGLSMLVGALVLAPLIINSRSEVEQPRALAIIAWLGLVATALAYSLYSKGLRRTSAITAGTLSMAEPLAAALLSTTFLGERLSAGEVLGCTVIFAGLLITVTGRAAGDRPVLTYDVSVVAVGLVEMPVGVALRPHMVGRRRVSADSRIRVPARGRAAVRTRTQSS